MYMYMYINVCTCNRGQRFIKGVGHTCVHIADVVKLWLPLYVHVHNTKSCISYLCILINM